MIRKYIHKSINGNTAVELIAKESDVDYDIHSMTICNTHTTDLLDIDIYIQYLNPKSHFPGKNSNWNEEADTYTTIYLLKNVEVDAGNTLVIEQDEVEFDSTKFGFYAKLGASDSTVDIIINLKNI